MTFKKTDAGRAKSLRPKQSRDCTVRSLATVATFSYDKAYDILKAAGRECSQGFDMEGWCRKTSLYDGANDHIYWRLQKMPFNKGERYGLPKSTQRYRLHDFIKDRPKGRFIVSTALHVFAVCDGVMYDDLPWHYVENRPVYAWMEALVVKGQLWQAFAIRRPVRKHLPLMRRRLGVVDAPHDTYKAALEVATKQYDWMLKKAEDMTVAPFLSLDQWP